MAGTVKQIIGSFEDIGKDIARETLQVPKDIVGKAIETLGTSSKKPQSTKSTQTPPTPESPQIPQKSSREWLAELAGKNKKSPEPTVQERLEKEKQEKNEKEQKQAAVAQKMAPLPVMSAKAKRGNLYGVTKQKSGSETSKNVRQD